MYTRKDVIWIAAILIVCVLILTSILSLGVYSSHDGEIHIARLAQFREAVVEGHLPVRWLANLNFGFGYPTFVYLYSLPYYFATMLTGIGANGQSTFKILMFLSLAISGVCFYLVAKKLTGKEIPAFVGSVFYVSAPYRFADIFERGALGESLVFIFLPLLFIAPKIIQENLLKGFIFTSLTIFAILTTHAITFAIFIVPAVLFSLLVFGQNSKKLQPTFLTFILFGFLLSSFQVLPVIFEQKYIELDKTYFNIFEGTFITANQLLRIPKEGINTGTGIQLGLAQSLVILFTLVLAIYDFLTKRVINKLTLFLVAASITAAFLTLDISKPVWLIAEPLQTILFPWRFLTFTTLATAILASFLVKRFLNNKYWVAIVMILFFLSLYPSRHYWRGYGWHSFSDDYYVNYQDPHKLDNYYLPKGLTKNLENLKLEPISTITKSGRAQLISRQNNRLEAMVDLPAPAKIQLHTMYFPGWELSIDGQRSPIITDYPGLEGIIVADVPKGIHHLNIKFAETSLRTLANILTLVSLIFLVGVLILMLMPLSLFRKNHGA